MYTSCQDSFVPLIRVDIYQKKIVRVLPLEDWINDSIRFLFMNLDKQTLKFPGLIFKLQSSKVFVKTRKVFRQHTFTSVINYLIKRLNKKRNSKMNLNVVLGSLFTKNTNIYHRLNTNNVNVNFIAKNSYLTKHNDVELTKYDEIVLFNLNPRLDSPLFDLKLKELDFEFNTLKSVGNYDNNYNVVTNNSKLILNQHNNNLLVYSESFKDNKLVLNFKNQKLNLSPVYLNNPNTFIETPIIKRSTTMTFNFGINEDFKQKDEFSVNFNTHISKLNFDIYMPISNYFVSPSEMISLKGVQKLRMIRPSYFLKDYIFGISVLLNKGTSKLILDSCKIYNLYFYNKYNYLFNRLSYFYKKALLLQK